MSRGIWASSGKAGLIGLGITNVEQGEALLSGSLPDQAALHGVLTKIRDLGLPLLEVHRVATESSEKGQEVGE